MLLKLPLHIRSRYGFSFKIGGSAALSREQAKLHFAIVLSERPTNGPFAS